MGETLIRTGCSRMNAMNTITGISTTISLGMSITTSISIMSISIMNTGTNTIITNTTITLKRSTTRRGRGVSACKLLSCTPYVALS